MLLGIAFLVVEAFLPTVGARARRRGRLSVRRRHCSLDTRGAGLCDVMGHHRSAAALTLGLALLTGTYVWAARRNPPRVGGEAHARPAGRDPRLAGRRGSRARLQGERWRAKADDRPRTRRQRRGHRVSDLVLDRAAARCGKEWSKTMIIGYRGLSVACAGRGHFLSAAIAHPEGIQRGVVFHARPLHGGQGSRPHHPRPSRPADGEGRPAHRGAGRAAAGRHLARQRLGEGQRGALFPHRRCRSRP